MAVAPPFAASQPAAELVQPALEVEITDVAALPNAPGFSTSTASAGSVPGDDSASGNTTQPRPPMPRTARIGQKVIQPGQQAPRPSLREKIALGMYSSVSPKAMAGWVGVSLYEQAIDTSPNYGQTFRGYAQRLGAAVARDSSEAIFSDAILAPAFHEDPRYYRLGPGQNGVYRFLYASTRTLVTRTDDGRPTPNFSLLGGNLAGAALTQAYYPSRDTGFKPTLKTFGSSLLGSSVGFLVDEYFRDVFGFVFHHESPE
jgi:hypothetical protein